MIRLLSFFGGFLIRGMGRLGVPLDLMEVWSPLFGILINFLSFFSLFFSPLFYFFSISYWLDVSSDPLWLCYYTYVIPIGFFVYYCRILLGTDCDVSPGALGGFSALLQRGLPLCLHGIGKVGPLRWFHFALVLLEHRTVSRFTVGRRRALWGQLVLSDHNTHVRWPISLRMRDTHGATAQVAWHV